MRHLDLFAGIGGFSLAASWMGWKTVAQVEWDKYCQKVLAKNFPDVLRFGDIVEFNKMLQDGEIITNTNGTGSRKIGTYIKPCKEQKKSDDNRPMGKNGQFKNDKGFYLGRIDIITGGFPCQPFSHAGKRKGTDDSRYLWPEMLTTIRILKPSFVVGENVAGLVSMENGKTLDNILSDLANEGYQTEQFIIPACSIGAWHRRDRIWIVGINTDCKSKRTGGLRNKVRTQGTRNSIKLSGKLGRVFPDSISERRCSRNGERKYAEDVRQQFGSQEYGYWNSEPSVGRVANGISNRVDRLKGLGNAIVPQIAFEIFKAIEQIN